MSVYLVGAGPGDPGLLTLKGKELLERADVVIYDALANASLLSLAKKEAEIIYVGKRASLHALPQEEINALLIRKGQEGKSVVRLKGGDPYVFGRGGEEAQALQSANIPFEEVPGISSTIAAPAYAGIPVTHRDLVSAVTCITGHETPSKESSSLNWKAYAESGATLVFVMGVKNLPNIVANLLGAGMDPETPAAIIYRGTTAAQRTHTTSLAKLAIEAKERGFTNPSVIVVGQVVTLTSQLNWFEQKPLFGHTVVVTRAREQASDIVHALEVLGAEVLQAPSIAIAPVTDTAPIDAAIKNMPNFQWCLFTSANGVKLFFERLFAVGKDARLFGATKICAIGPATAEALSNYGLRADLLPKRFVAESVVEAIKEVQTTAARILLPRAAKARDVLPKALRALGHSVDVVPLYTTVADEGEKDVLLAKLSAHEISCISFASTSTVENFLAMVPADLLRAHPEVHLAAIGPITAQALTAKGLTCTIQPEHYTIPDLVEAIKHTLTQRTSPCH